MSETTVSENANTNDSENKVSHIADVSEIVPDELLCNHPQFPLFGCMFDNVKCEDCEYSP